MLSKNICTRNFFLHRCLCQSTVSEEFFSGKGGCFDEVNMTKENRMAKLYYLKYYLEKYNVVFNHLGGKSLSL